MSPESMISRPTVSVLGSRAIEACIAPGCGRGPFGIVAIRGVGGLPVVMVFPRGRLNRWSEQIAGPADHR
jgi:hypothetical protein